MPTDLSKMTDAELLAGYKAAQAREMGPPKPSFLQTLQTPEGARGFFDKQSQDMGFKDSEDQVNAMSNRMALGLMGAPVVRGLLSKVGLMGAGESAGSLTLNNSAGAIKNLPPPGAPLFEGGSASASAPQGAGVLSKVGGFLKTKLGGVGASVAGGQLAIEAGKKLWEKKGEIADKAMTLGAGLLPEDAANKLKNWATGANPNDLTNMTNDELMQGYRQSLAREKGQKQ